MTRNVIMNWNKYKVNIFPVPQYALITWTTLSRQFGTGLDVWTKHGIYLTTWFIISDHLWADKKLPEKCNYELWHSWTTSILPGQHCLQVFSLIQGITMCHYPCDLACKSKSINPEWPFKTWQNLLSSYTGNAIMHTNMYIIHTLWPSSISTILMWKENWFYVLAHFFTWNWGKGYSFRQFFLFPKIEGQKAAVNCPCIYATSNLLIFKIPVSGRMLRMTTYSQRLSCKAARLCIHVEILSELRVIRIHRNILGPFRTPKIFFEEFLEMSISRRTLNFFNSFNCPIINVNTPACHCLLYDFVS